MKIRRIEKIVSKGFIERFKFKRAMNKNILIHLSLIETIGPGAVSRIICVLKDNHADKEIDLHEIYDYTESEFVERFGLSRTSARKAVAGLADKKMLESELAYIKKYDIHILNFLDPDYPELLKHIHMPPIILYCKGEKLSVNAKRIAFVGPRKSGRYAQTVIDSLLPPLIENDWEIVSGGAIGVDTMAHKKTVDCGGKTIVVLGSGLLKPYPKRNKELFRKVLQNGGTLVSPFPLQAEPLPGHFPARNRIIAGLSQGSVVVQAAQKSGALITAQFALDEGRQVFAVPGDVHDELSAGCHKLIQTGAKLVSNANDILEEFGEEVPVILNEGDDKNTTFSSRVVSSESEKLYRGTTGLMSFLQTPTSIDDLSVRANKGHAELLDELFNLQLEGRVKQNFAGLWELV